MTRITTVDNLLAIQVKPIREDIYNQIKLNWDHIAKPLNGLGDLESITARIGAINVDEKIDISKRAVVMMCADNGIIEEGVSQSDSDVTLAVSMLMGRGESSVCKMAKVAGADTFAVDVGIKDGRNIPGVLDRKITGGTRNFIKEPAMTRQQTIEAIAIGIGTIKDLKDEGYKIVATGEMGIGNTTTSSALSAALLGMNGEQIAGRGAGLSDKGLHRKISIIDEAIKKYDLYNQDAFTCLECVGGLDIAALCGCFIGGALYQMPVIIDGMISATSALVADKLIPGIRDYCIPSHVGAERGMKYIFDSLGFDGIIHARLALGEGTGAVMMFPLLDMALSLYQTGVKFTDTQIDQYVRYV